MTAMVSETYYDFLDNVVNPEAMELCSSEDFIQTPETCSDRDHITFNPDCLDAMQIRTPNTDPLQESELRGASQSLEDLELGPRWHASGDLSASEASFQQLAPHDIIGSDPQQWQVYSPDAMQQGPHLVSNSHAAMHAALWPPGNEYPQSAPPPMPQASNGTSTATQPQLPTQQALPWQQTIPCHPPSQFMVAPQTINPQVSPYMPMQVVQQQNGTYVTSYGQMFPPVWTQQPILLLGPVFSPVYATYPTSATQVQTGTHPNSHFTAMPYSSTQQSFPSSLPVSQTVTTRAMDADVLASANLSNRSATLRDQTPRSPILPQQANHSTVLSGFGKNKSKRRPQPASKQSKQSLQAEAPVSTIVSAKGRHAERRRNIAECKPLRPKDGSFDSPPEPKQPRKGKRTKQLEPETSAQASRLRKMGDCWRCAIQRDKCADEEVCPRCVKAMLRGEPFGCERIKLYDLTKTFLPDFMTSTHQHQAIQNAVNSEVLNYRQQTTFELVMTIGWGKPLKWPVCVFEPRTSIALVQHQYFQDPATRQMMRFAKYSPPLVISRLESDNEHFSQYLDSLYTQDQLHDFSEMCYASESRHETFQEDLLALLCKLYLSHDDQDERPKKGRLPIGMKSLLKRIIRMLILTYIMGHTMTIVESTLPDVLARVPPAPASCQQYDMPWARGRKQISPRLANRQLKYYFCLLRNAIYSEILRGMQPMFASSVDKDQTWLPVFCCMLGFAMVLEEVQCNLQIQADSKANDENLDIEEAQNGARIACEQIDERYGLMMELFKRKYRDKAWIGKGSFTNQTPRLQHPAEVDFLRKLEELVIDRREYLKGRKEVKIGHEYQCLYGSRLISRFLLPFLDLPE